VGGDLGEEWPELDDGLRDMCLGLVEDLEKKRRREGERELEKEEGKMWGIARVRVVT